MEAKEKIKELEDEISEKKKEIELYTKLLENFPDLIVSRERGGRIYLQSESVNPITENFDTGYSCGCCPDASYLIQPYIKIENTKVYSYPRSFCIGEKARYTRRGYILLDEDSTKEMRKCNISQKIIDEINLHAKNIKQEKEELDAQDEFEDYDD